VLGGALLWLGAPRWASSSDRFDRTTVDSPETAMDDPAGLWKALDAGLDPTVARNASTAPGQIGPDVHIGATRDTMVPQKGSSPEVLPDLDGSDLSGPGPGGQEQTEK
jgi:hypothetical protein